MQYYLIAKIAIKCLKWLSKRSENKLDDKIVDFVGDVVDIAKPDDAKLLSEVKEIIEDKNKEK